MRFFFLLVSQKKKKYNLRKLNSVFSYCLFFILSMETEQRYTDKRVTLHMLLFERRYGQQNALSNLHN